jgi:hypothetical protein
VEQRGDPVLVVLDLLRQGDELLLNHLVDDEGAGDGMLPESLHFELAVLGTHEAVDEGDLLGNGSDLAQAEANDGLVQIPAPRRGAGEHR